MPTLDLHHHEKPTHIQSRELWQDFFTDEQGKVLGYDVDPEKTLLRVIYAP